MTYSNKTRRKNREELRRLIRPNIVDKTKIFFNVMIEAEKDAWREYRKRRKFVKKFGM